MSKVYEIVTNEIIKKLESVDLGNWQKPWFDVGYSPCNAISKKAYRGINNLLLRSNGHQSGMYASYKQWSEKDCQVIKGSKGHIVVFWKFGEYEDEETGENKTSVLCRYYKVFNSEQVEGDYARKIEAEKLRELNNHDAVAESETFIDRYLRKELIKTEKSDRACYSSVQDRIQMPELGQFDSPENYYSTFLHEMTHSTGHEKRLGRRVIIDRSASVTVRSSL